MPEEKISVSHFGRSPSVSGDGINYGIIKQSELSQSGMRKCRARRTFVSWDSRFDLNTSVGRAGMKSGRSVRLGIYAGDASPFYPSVR